MQSPETINMQNLGKNWYQQLCKSQVSEEASTPVDMPHLLQMFYGNLSE